MSGIREKQLQKRKRETLDAALRLLLERGYANLNMDELAIEVGISKPTLYQYFDSKDELVAQAVAKMFEKMEAQVSALPEKSPAGQLEHFMRSMLKARSEQRYLQGPGDAEVMRSIVRHHPRIRQHMLATKNKLEALVRQAQELGEIDPAFPAWVIVNVMFGLQRVITPPFEKDEPQRSEQELAAAIDSLVCLFRRGVSLPVAMQT